ncbi:MAG: hypothetical protein S0880_00035 [Actinomycetota bacterium]|nr:hypothetical protein [Actinomycetota bacterium]
MMTTHRDHHPAANAAPASPTGDTGTGAPATATPGDGRPPDGTTRRGSIFEVMFALHRP